MKKKSDNVCSWCCCNSNFLAIFFIIVGGYFLAVGLGWIPSNFPFWALLLLFYGLYLLTKSQKK